ncbi:MAG: long-chain fatty acid--CoA ligase [Bdellovibrio sp.]|nr:long-chain fatty acid--CoA ligase [Bdellovibrio sp.]
MTVGKWLLDLQNRPDGCAIKYKKDLAWNEINWAQYLDKIILMAEQIQKITIHQLASRETNKKHVGILSSTRWEWSIIDLAILGCGHVTVPFYPNMSDADLLFIINHSDISFIIVENAIFEKQIERIREKFERSVLVKKFEDLDFDSAPSSEAKQNFFKSCESLQLKDIATLVYTSGTTGQPKGAVLLHESIVSEVEEIFSLVGIKPHFTSLTFLPMAHVMGRIELWGNCFNGHTLAYAESIDKLKSNLLEIQPDFMVAVPRIFEKFYAAIMAKVETQPFKQKLFNHAISVSTEVLKYRERREVVPWGLLLQHETLCRVVFAPVKKAFGGKLQFAVSGGAPLSKDLANFFAYCGIQVLEGYGLTETCAAIAVNTPYNFHPGTVGLPMGDCDIKFAADGEILVRSKKVFKEYYKNPEATASSFVDGYFATGDIGEFTSGGQLKITDRKKDLIKTAGGKYVAPQKLENLLKQDPMIAQVLIHGDQKKFISAIISVEEPAVKAWADSQNIPYQDISEIYQNPALRLRVQKQIQKTNSEIANYEAIKKFEIVSDTWSVENGALTPSLKVKRKFIETKYAELISEMYE